jgi:hypothetical protein
MSARLAKIAVAGIAVSSLLAACGGSSEPADTSPSDTAVAETTTSTTPVATLPAMPQTTPVPLTNVVPADVPLPNVTCADIAPPKDFRLSDAANAHVEWTAVMAPPPETSPNQLNLEVSTDNGTTWKRSSFMRISLTSALLLEVKPGTTILVRAQLYRAFKNPCVTEYSKSLELKIN